MPRPEQFDILGLGVFTFITVLFSRALITGGEIPYLAKIILLLIGIFGLLIDGSIVYRYFFKK